MLSLNTLFFTRGPTTEPSERGQVTRCSRQVPSSIMGAKIM